MLRARRPQETAVFYERLGFTRRVQHPAAGEPSFVGLVRDGTELALTAAGPDDAPGTDGGTFELYVFVADVDAAVAELRTTGVPVVSGPADTPWGERVATVHDPDGTRVALAAPAG
ncbi:VOC family protein [Streptomyces sp. NPDC058657]|uniref:VOC family protein n=1 Tax=unclassified Streptomyces TaxID=2593676 RepID=UPI0036543F73